MKITIDTKEDSHDDLKKVVKMLQALIDGHTNAPMDIFSDPSSGSGNSEVQPGIFNIFGDDGSSVKPESQSSGSQISEPISTILDEKKDDEPRVITY